MVPDAGVCVMGLRSLHIIVKKSKAYKTAAPYISLIVLQYPGRSSLTYWLDLSETMSISKKQCTVTQEKLVQAYLRSVLSYHIPARALCSSNTNLLSVSHVHTTFAFRTFSAAARSVWNSLPDGIRACTSPHTFRRLLKKTHRFDQAFSSP